MPRLLLGSLLSFPFLGTGCFLAFFKVLGYGFFFFYLGVQVAKFDVEIRACMLQVLGSDALVIGCLAPVSFINPTKDRMSFAHAINIVSSNLNETKYD